MQLTFNGGSYYIFIIFSYPIQCVIKQSHLPPPSPRIVLSCVLQDKRSLHDMIRNPPLFVSDVAQH